jgi:spoIIIJ-associated protein
LLPLLSRAGFQLSYQLITPLNPHPEVENPEVTVVFSGSDVEMLLLNRAELLLALEHISMEALRLPPEDHSLISFDANDYRMLRVEELRLSALAAAERVKRSRIPFHFNPMSSRERRIIHLALRDEKELRSESLGVGPARAVVVVPADMPTPPAPPVAPREFNRGGFNRTGTGARPGGSRPGGGGFRGPREGGAGPRGDRPRGPRGPR